MTIILQRLAVFLLNRNLFIQTLFYTLVTAFVYFISAKMVGPLSLSESSSIFAIWLPAGVALSFLFFRGNVVIPGIFLGAFFLNLTLSSPVVAFEIAIGNTFGPAVTYWLINRCSQCGIKDDFFYDTDTILSFLFYSVIGALITSSMGTTILYLNGLLYSEDQFLGWAVWFFGDLIGFILIVPIFVTYVLQRNMRIISIGHIAEIILILMVLLVTSTLVFGSGYFFDIHYPIAYLVLFPLIWASIRLPLGISLIFLIIVSIFAIFGTASGYSQFFFAGDYKLSLIMLQMFIFTMTFSILMMTAQRSYTIRVLEEKEHLILTDPLTQVGNRRFFTQIMEEELDKMQRYKRSLSLILFDIDRFKKINDTLGHYAGDSVLEELCALVNTRLRSSDHLARWGGEEFMIVLPETTLEQAAITAEKLRKTIEIYPFSIKQGVTCSFGVIQCSDSDTVDSALTSIDAKLYKAKDSGRNKVES